MYLGDTMSSLDTSFDKIHKMLANQFGDIKESFERSRHIPRIAHLQDYIFSEVRCQISLEAMEIISAELKCVDETPYQSQGRCKCKTRNIYGLPCKHDLAYYRQLSIPIPLATIHSHWRRLSMHIHDEHAEESRRDRTAYVVEKLQSMDPEMREHMIDRFIDMADPSQSTVRPPSYTVERKGRPSEKDERVRQHNPRVLDISSGSSGLRSKIPSSPRLRRPKIRTGFRTRRPTTNRTRFGSAYNIYISQLTAVMHPYISDIVDVVPDGNCGFRAIAALIGYDESNWMQIRLDLCEEIREKKSEYDVLFPDRSTADHLLMLLEYFETPAPPRHWMDSMTLGTVIASRYNLVLYAFGGTNSSCFTHLPLRSPPINEHERVEIAIGHVGNHFVQVILEDYHPVPPVPMWWWSNASYEARGWASAYTEKFELWRQITNTGPPGAEFGGTID